MALKVKSSEVLQPNRKTQSAKSIKIKRTITRSANNPSQPVRKILHSIMNYGNQHLNSIRPRKQPKAINTIFSSWGNTYANDYNNFNGKSHLEHKARNTPRDVLISRKSPGRDFAEMKLGGPSGKIKGGDVLTHFAGCNSYVRNYLQKSTLHGMRYIGDGNLSLLERVFWFISVFVAVLFAGYYIGNLYARWDTSPMIVSLNPDFADITSIPFPAITICNINQAKKSVADRILKEGKPMDLKLLEAICNVSNYSAVLDIDSSSKAGQWKYFKKFLINVTQPCPLLIPFCRWRSEPRTCETLFNTALTDEGLCCTFNSVHRDMMFRNPRDLSDLNVTFPFPAVDWTPESGYPPTAPAEGFPWRPIGPGANLGLTLVLDADIHEYYCSSTSSAGFKILLHNPSETPKIADYGDLIAPGLELRVAVKPRIYDFQPQLRNIAVGKRKCYFSDEKKLIFYRTYTKKNCVMECETRLTIQWCNCSQYFMPKNSTVRICGMADYKCYTELKIAIEDKLGVNESSVLGNTNCDECFPACYELSYDKDTSSSLLTDTFQLREEDLAGKTPKYFKNNMAIVHIYFLETAFIRYTKGELYGFTDFLSNTGGLLGLFLGFSFLSFIEIMYFLSLRFMCVIYRENHKKSGTVYPFSE